MLSTCKYPGPLPQDRSLKKVEVQFQSLQRLEYIVGLERKTNLHGNGIHVYSLCKGRSTPYIILGKIIPPLIGNPRNGYKTPTTSIAFGFPIPCHYGKQWDFPEKKETYLISPSLFSHPVRSNSSKCFDVLRVCKRTSAPRPSSLKHLRMQGCKISDGPNQIQGFLRQCFQTDNMRTLNIYQKSSCQECYLDNLDAT